MPTADYSFVASGGIRISGPRHYKLDACYEASGGVRIGGSAVVHVGLNTYSYTMTGGITVSGPDDNIVDYDYETEMCGPLVSIGGSADVHLGSPAFTHTMTGGVHLGGSYTGRADYAYNATGGIVMGGTANGKGTVPEIYIDLPMGWAVYADVVADLEIGWNTGDSIFYFYRVEGVCLPNNCPPLGDDTGNEKACNFSFIKNVVADSVCEVCAQLKRDGFIRTIKTIKKFSKPARRADRALLESQGIPQDCDRLEEVPFCQCVECTSFCDYEDVSVNPTGTRIVTETDEPLTYVFFNYQLVDVYSSDDGQCRYIFYLGPWGSTYIPGAVPKYESWSYPFPCRTSSEEVNAPNYEAVVSGRVRIGGQAVVSWKPNVIDMVPVQETIKTACDCNDLPTVIWMRHNFAESNKLKDFLYRNALTFASDTPMYYDKNNQSWISNLNWDGLSRDGVTKEVWNVIFEWACTSTIGSQDLGAPFWKFGAYFNVRNVDHNTSSSTRILMTFSRLGPCINGEVDFKIVLNTLTLQGDSDSRHQVENALMLDHIGLFKSSFWAKNPRVNVEVTAAQQPNSPRTVSIGPYAPTNEIVRKT